MHAICKHGRSHREVDASCGFCHTLDEASAPHSVSRRIVFSVLLIDWLRMCSPRKKTNNPISIIIIIVIIFIIIMIIINIIIIFIIISFVSSYCTCLACSGGDHRYVDWSPPLCIARRFRDSHRSATGPRPCLLREGSHSATALRLALESILAASTWFLPESYLAD